MMKLACWSVEKPWNKLCGGAAVRPHSAPSGSRDLRVGLACKALEIPGVSEVQSTSLAAATSEDCGPLQIAGKVLHSCALVPPEPTMSVNFARRWPIMRDYL